MFRTKRGRGLRRPSILVASALIAGLGFATVPATTALAGPTSLCPDAVTVTFGPYVCVFTPSMTQTAIQNDVNAVAVEQVPTGSQFDSTRYALLFEPGTYGTSANPLVFQVGYYTEVAGLGEVPQDVTINGAIDAFANTLEYGTPPGGTCCSYWTNSTDNFWRSLSNLTLNVAPNGPNYPAFVPPVLATEPPISNGNCWNGAEFWSVSQAAPLRSVIVNGSVIYQQYCTGQGYSGTDFASGGFNANDEVSGALDFYGQQQYYTRDSEIGSAAGAGPGGQGLWNEVYSGVLGAPAPVFTGQSYQNTVIAATPTTEEPPYLYVDGHGNWNVFVPAVQTNTSGPNFLSGSEAGSSLPLRDFFIANPSTPAVLIDAANALGKDIIFEPGIYSYNTPVVISHPDSIVLSLGFATFVPSSSNADMIVLPNNGVKLGGGIIFDAGAQNSPFLLEAGNQVTPANPADPDLFSDVFFRVGGAESPAATNFGFLDEASNSIIDDSWFWRADHGETATSTGWTVNTSGTGLVVDANNVEALSLAVEHFQQNEVVWDGQGGRVEFFQNELPYDVPNQAAWMETPTQEGYPAFLVTPNVTTFQGFGMGSYVVFISTNASIYDAEAFEAPQNAGVQFTNLFTDYISSNAPGGLNSIIDGVGGAATNVTDPSAAPVDLASFS